MTKTKAFAPAKINLCLHVTGQRADGYHLLDSLVAFAEVGDHLTLTRSEVMQLQVTGPMAQGVPTDGRNLCWKAAKAFGQPAAITLDKHLPAAAGIGGGSSDAAAVLRGMSDLYGTPFGGEALTLGADVPVCMAARAARMEGIGEVLTPLALPRLPAVLVNPRVEVSTPDVFRALASKTNPALEPLPADGADVIAWLRDQRNDLQPPAVALQPVIGDVLQALSACEGTFLARMSGSGATCFAIMASDEAAARAATALGQKHPNWWIAATALS
ncbi:4-(cytidine 5'-diphospho)-2-C-methyl-D-erythritol kinase [Pseudoprimorskyibacter insulae]|uniref:4-diphosphocytidyl-2-C-methyl-D-erythritol kinase n=1 Tax=Pseudoprimorskyibacter insulae TaxID=1695997 RepID=A0A2R8AP68_9RHOB|nr:4-(cytidine 5'-diphospho)-2-C-methyl-D-erythritol kinase [Pseudoprimorskyibacter insulae]SPF77654.1 4-diphosphocytidyl-2-C-methyl-D-erythritol kinase [Pseudoprimorskyibacter insulae]